MGDSVLRLKVKAENGKLASAFYRKCSKGLSHNSVVKANKIASLMSDAIFVY